MKTYITLLNDPSYLKGTLVLYESLKRTNTRFPFTVLVTHAENLQREINLLKSIEKSDRNFYVLLHEPIKLPAYVNEFLGKYSFEAWINSFDKLLVFDLEQYDKVVFLDSDMVILKNIDSLFDKEHLTAVQDAYWPLPLHENNRGMNSGVMVIKPQVHLSQEIMTAFPSLLERKQGKPIGDQDVIQEYFKRWKHNEKQHLSLGYNYFFTNIHKAVTMHKWGSWGGKQGLYLFNQPVETLFVVHFVGKKPWKERSLLQIIKRIGYNSLARAYVALYFEYIYQVINRKYRV